MTNDRADRTTNRRMTDSYNSIAWAELTRIYPLVTVSFVSNWILVILKLTAIWRSFLILQPTKGDWVISVSELLGIYMISN